MNWSKYSATKWNAHRNCVSWMNSNDRNEKQIEPQERLCPLQLQMQLHLQWGMEHRSQVEFIGPHSQMCKREKLMEWQKLMKKTENVSSIYAVYLFISCMHVSAMPSSWRTSSNSTKCHRFYCNVLCDFQSQLLCKLRLLCDNKNKSKSNINK